MGRKKKYSSDAEKQKAHRERKQQKPLKLSNKQLIEIAKQKYVELVNPTRNELIYGLMASENWSRTKATESTNLFELTEKIVFAEKTEQVKPESENGEVIKQATRDPELRKFLSRAPNEYKEELKTWMGWMHNPKRFEYEKNKRELLLWLLQKKGIWNYHFFTYSEGEQDALEQEFNQLPEEYRLKLTEWLTTGNKPIGFSI